MVRPPGCTLFLVILGPECRSAYVSFHFQNFSLSPSIVSLIKTKSSAYNISLIKPFLTLSVTTSTTIAKTNGDNTDPWCTPTSTSNSSDNSSPTVLWLLSLHLHTNSLLLSPLPLVYLYVYIFISCDRYLQNGVKDSRLLVTTPYPLWQL